MLNLLSRVRFNIPIRFKLLVTQLLVVTTAVGVITFTMARLFHTDKTAYVHDLTSVMALQTAEESSALLRTYREKLQVFARVMSAEDISPDQKSAMLKKLFEDFREFVMITRYEGDRERATVYDAKTLEGVGLSKDQFLAARRANPLPFERIRGGEVHVENSTLSGKLPVITLAIADSSGGDGKGDVVAAVVKLDSLIKLTGRSRVFDSFIIDEKGVLLAHADVGKVATHAVMKELPRLTELRGGGSLGTTVEYTQNGVDMVGGFGRVEFAGLVAGVQIPSSAAYLTARSLLNSLLWVSLALLMAAALVSFFWSHRLTRPIEELSNATRVVGRGEFDIHVESPARDEIGALADSFNRMAHELKTREEALKEAHAQLIQSEKMAAFGQLGAGIAHEVKNPLAGILGYAQLSLRKVKDGDPLHGNLKIIEKETKRCKNIIDNLMKFARQEKVSFMATEINQVVEDAVAIVDHQLTINGVKLEKELSPNLPGIMGNGNQIQQVLMNLMINAQQAMEGNPGTVRLSTALADSSRIEVRVADTGPGIPEEIRAKIFEPFFTTKSAGKGTGLGLSVSYGIIRDHKGDIRVESEQGVGTTFIITLPVKETDTENDVISEEA
ncbi:MAG: HAMP domain-containing sensor histidine kinase [Desulfuromonadales bacterium]|nr:MAG: HAMP domain-containing sensor histidine kinase [Desulfuromonadales bacterium]